MTLTITLTPAEEEQLRARAAQTGQDTDEFVHAVVRQTLAAPAAGDEDEMPAPGESLADAFAGRIGGFHSGGDGTLSQNTGEAFTEYVVEKHRQGHL